MAQDPLDNLPEDWPGAGEAPEPGSAEAGHLGEGFPVPTPDPLSKTREEDLPDVSWGDSPAAPEAGQPDWPSRPDPLASVPDWPENAHEGPQEAMADDLGHQEAGSLADASWDRPGASAGIPEALWPSDEPMAPGEEGADRAPDQMVALLQRIADALAGPQGGLPDIPGYPGAGSMDLRGLAAVQHRSGGGMLRASAETFASASSPSMNLSNQAGGGGAGGWGYGSGDVTPQQFAEPHRRFRG